MQSADVALVDPSATEIRDSSFDGGTAADAEDDDDEGDDDEDEEDDVGG